MKEFGKFVLLLLQAVVGVIDVACKLFYELAKLVFWIACLPVGLVLVVVVLFFFFFLLLFLPVSRMERLRAFFARDVKKKKRKLHPVFAKQL